MHSQSTPPPPSVQSQPLHRDVCPLPMRAANGPSAASAAAMTRGAVLPVTVEEARLVQASTYALWEQLYTPAAVPLTMERLLYERVSLSSATGGVHNEGVAARDGARQRAGVCVAAQPWVAALFTTSTATPSQPVATAAPVAAASAAPLRTSTAAAAPGAQPVRMKSEEGEGGQRGMRPPATPPRVFCDFPDSPLTTAAPVAAVALHAADGPRHSTASSSGGGALAPAVSVSTSPPSVPPHPPPCEADDGSQPMRLRPCRGRATSAASPPDWVLPASTSDVSLSSTASLSPAVAPTPAPTYAIAPATRISGHLGNGVMETRADAAETNATVDTEGWTLVVASLRVVQEDEEAHATALAASPPHASPPAGSCRVSVRSSSVSGSLRINEEEQVRASGRLGGVDLTEAAEARVDGTAKSDGAASARASSARDEEEAGQHKRLRVGCAEECVADSGNDDDEREERLLSLTTSPAPDATAAPDGTPTAPHEEPSRRTCSRDGTEDTDVYEASLPPPPRPSSRRRETPAGAHEGRASAVPDSCRRVGRGDDALNESPPRPVVCSSTARPSATPARATAAASMSPLGVDGDGLVYSPPRRQRQQQLLRRLQEPSEPAWGAVEDEEEEGVAAAADGEDTLMDSAQWRGESASPPPAPVKAHQRCPDHEERPSLWSSASTPSPPPRVAQTPVHDSPTPTASHADGIAEVIGAAAGSADDATREVATDSSCPRNGSTVAAAEEDCVHRGDEHTDSVEAATATPRPTLCDGGNSSAVAQDDVAGDEEDHSEERAGVMEAAKAPRDTPSPIRTPASTHTLAASPTTQLVREASSSPPPPAPRRTSTPPLASLPAAASQAAASPVEELTHSSTSVPRRSVSTMDFTWAVEVDDVLRRQQQRLRSLQTVSVAGTVCGSEARRSPSASRGSPARTVAFAPPAAGVSAGGPHLYPSPRWGTRTHSPEEGGEEGGGGARGRRARAGEEGPLLLPSRLQGGAAEAWRGPHSVSPQPQDPLRAMRAEALPCAAERVAASEDADASGGELVAFSTCRSADGQVATAHPHAASPSPPPSRVHRHAAGGLAANSTRGASSRPPAAVAASTPTSSLTHRPRDAPSSASPLQQPLPSAGLKRQREAHEVRDVSRSLRGARPPDRDAAPGHHTGDRLDHRRRRARHEGSHAHIASASNRGGGGDGAHSASPVSVFALPRTLSTEPGLRAASPQPQLSASASAASKAPPLRTRPVNRMPKAAKAGPVKNARLARRPAAPTAATAITASTSTTPRNAAAAAAAAKAMQISQKAARRKPSLVALNKRHGAPDAEQKK